MPSGSSPASRFWRAARRLHPATSSRATRGRSMALAPSASPVPSATTACRAPPTAASLVVACTNPKRRGALQVRCVMRCGGVSHDDRAAPRPSASTPIPARGTSAARSQGIVCSNRFPTRPRAALGSCVGGGAARVRPPPRCAAATGASTRGPTATTVATVRLRVALGLFAWRVAARVRRRRHGAHREAAPTPPSTRKTVVLVATVVWLPLGAPMANASCRVPWGRIAAAALAFPTTLR
jgi:hypothetical protein